MQLKFPAETPKTAFVRAHIPATLIAAGALVLCSAATALADSNTSSNWAGYAVHRSGVRFRTIGSLWRQPKASCRRGNQTYSAVWVGLGGYSASSNALEQIGTEIDCSASGRTLSSAWYELVPAASEPIPLTVRPGDLMAASVTVVGHRVEVKLANVTRHRSFARTLNAAAIDVTSAEWIVEAPSDCVSATACQTLPLANFGTTGFSFASVRSTSGVLGSIASRSWGTTAITLTPGGRRYIAYRGSGPAGGAAKPSKLSPDGSAFTVNYTKVSAQGGPFFSGRRAASSGGYLVHPGR